MVGDGRAADPPEATSQNPSSASAKVVSTIDNGLLDLGPVFPHLVVVGQAAPGEHRPQHGLQLPSRRGARRPRSARPTAAPPAASGTASPARRVEPARHAPEPGGAAASVASVRWKPAGAAAETGAGEGSHGTSSVDAGKYMTKEEPAGIVGGNEMRKPQPELKSNG